MPHFGLTEATPTIRCTRSVKYHALNYRIPLQSRCVRLANAVRKTLIGYNVN